MEEESPLDRAFLFLFSPCSPSPPPPPPLPMDSSSSSSSPLPDWAEWMPECLHSAIDISAEMSFHHDRVQEEDDDDEEDPLDTAPEEEEDDRQEQLHIDNYRFQEHPRFGHHRHAHQQQQQHHPHRHQPQPQQQQQQQNHPQQQRAFPFGNPPCMVCLSCKEAYNPRGAGTCRECYEEASETEEVLKKEIEELNARILFLKTWAPEVMNDEGTDLVLECSDGSKIRAHRAVLVSRSSVFKAMLDNEMEESRSGVIKVTDFAYEVLRLFVHYLYTAEIYPESLDECAFDLLALAEKYNVKYLKSVCERFMTSKLNANNALFSYEYASQHGAKTLKDAALSTILENIHELPAKEEYRELVNRDAKLVVEIFEAYLASKTS